MRAIQVRRGTTTAWTASNPILALGEPGYDIDTEVLKIGDGVQRWLDLSEIGSGGGGGDGITDEDRARFTFAGVPEIFHDFVGLSSPGSAAPAVATSGQSVHWAAGYGAAPYFANGSFLALAPGGAVYWCTEDMGANVTHVAGRFVFAPNGGTAGGTACVAITDKKMTPANVPNMNMSVHFYTTWQSWAITVWVAGTGQVVIDNGNYATPLLRDAKTMYDLEAWISGDRGTFLLPNGERRYHNDARFASLTGRFAFVESLMNAGTDDFVCVVNALAATGNTRAPARV
ncbi:hypothetical protein CH275_19150 [Rhodococcus sp. 06-235-1A]|uniref:hyaluronate lyase N-terminal domain-containing protein n=1 Tax=Rhodococcus sp. 06-235-1A TaxID=2022508 RepID=UPI000B9AEBF6|nr:hypothetical protein [Rhodococcus sp. 06-235-1A]OZD00906.1 hypothetical protein CH275_19150 [Rhodococcus sp. 06-235-1A]